MTAYGFPWLSLDYTDAYYPSAPVVPVEIAGPEMDDWLLIEGAFVDSGADLTLIPTPLIAQITATRWDRAWLRSQWGEPRLVRRHEIDLRIAGRTFPSLLIVEDDQVILGRNFLQYVRVLLDGPANTLTLLE